MARHPVMVDGHPRPRPTKKPPAWLPRLTAFCCPRTRPITSRPRCFSRPSESKLLILSGAILFAIWSTRCLVTPTKRRCARVHPTGAGVLGISHCGKSRRRCSPHRRRGVGLACWTQDEIAESEGMSQPAVLAILSEFPELEKLIKSHQTLATYSEPDWTPPIYNPQAQGVDYIGPQVQCPPAHSA